MKTENGSLRWIFKNVLDGVAEWIKYATYLVLVGVGSTAVLLIKNYGKYPVPLWIALLLAVLLVIVTAMSAASMSSMRRLVSQASESPEIQSAPPECPEHPTRDYDYEIVKLTIFYTIVEGRLHYERLFEVRALKDNVREIFGQFSWTGSSKCGLPTIESDYGSIREVRSRGLWRRFAVTLNRTLMEGSTARFSIKWPVLEDWRDSRAIASATIKYPTSQVEFIIQIPQDELQSERAALEKLRNAEDDDDLMDTKDIHFTNGRLTEIVSAPELHRDYCISWTWKDREHLSVDEHGRVLSETGA